MIHFTAANARERKKKKNTHNTSIENNGLLLGLCTYISFVCFLFFCLSHYPGGIIRSLQVGTHQLWHYRSWFPSISHSCQSRAQFIFRSPKLCPWQGMDGMSFKVPLSPNQPGNLLKIYSNTNPQQTHPHYMDHHWFFFVVVLCHPLPQHPAITSQKFPESLCALLQV